MRGIFSEFVAGSFRWIMASSWTHVLALGCAFARFGAKQRRVLGNLPIYLTACCGAAYGLERVATAQDIDEIMRAWRQRQDSAESVVIRWESKKAVTPLQNDRLESGVDALEELPKHECKLYLERDKARLENTIFHNDPDLRQSGATERIATENGTTEMRLIQRTGTLRHNIGFTGPEAKSVSVLLSAHLVPILIYFRPLTPEITGLKNASSFELVGQEIVAGEECYKVRRSDSLSGLIEVIWVTRNASYKPFQYAQYIGNVKLVHATIEYDQPITDDSLPSRWSVTLMRDEGTEIMESSAGIVIDIQMNQEIDDTLFTIDFPPNTLVTDIGKGL